MRGFDFDEALVALQNELHCFAYKLTADKDEAEDLLQETMLKALDNKDKFNPGTNFKGWMDGSFIFVDNGHDAKEIREALKTLPKAYYVVFMLYVSGVKYREIAAKIGVPLGTIKSRIFYSRKRLKQLLSDFA